MDNKIIEKIQKLLALATSPNENEAKAAAAKANALLVKHNITMQDVEVDLSYEKDVLDVNRRRPVEAKYINSILIGHFFVKIVERRNRREGTTTHFILGEETNVQVAKYIHSFLTRKFKELWVVYKKENDLPSSYKQSYYAGLMTGLDQQLTEKRQSTEQEYGIVLVDDPALNKFMNDAFNNNLKDSNQKFKIRVRDRQAMDDGAAAGKNLNIARGLDNDSTNSGRYLT